jgi:hypothetical protein
MSAEVMQMLARRWHCSVQDVRERITARCRAAGLLPDQPYEIRGYDGEPFGQRMTLGVTDDDRIAVLDADDRVVLWLDDAARERGQG